MNVFSRSSSLVAGFPRAKNLGIGRIKQDGGLLSGQGNLACVMDYAILQLSKFLILTWGP
jgi:hypothetical protein